MTKQIFRVLLIICLLCFVVNISMHFTSSANATNTAKVAINLEQIIDYGNSTQQTFSSLAGDTVFDILNQTTTVTFIQYAFGKFITAINDVENDANGNGYYWQYWVNGELAPVAADNFVLSDGDRVLWKYCAPESTHPTSPTLNLEFVAALGLIGVVGAIVVITASIVYYKMR